MRKSPPGEAGRWACGALWLIGKLTEINAAQSRICGSNKCDECASTATVQLRGALCDFQSKCRLGHRRRDSACTTAAVEARNRSTDAGSRRCGEVCAGGSAKEMRLCYHGWGRRHAQ